MRFNSFHKFGYSAVACSRVSHVQLVGCNLSGGRDGLYVSVFCMYCMCVGVRLCTFM